MDFNFDEFVLDLRREEEELEKSKCIICGRTKRLIISMGVPLCRAYNDNGQIIHNCKWIYDELMMHYDRYDDTSIPDVEVVDER